MIDLLSDRQRFALLATDTNRNYAHAVIYGGLTPTEASAFCTWLMRNGLTGNDPAEGLRLYLAESDGANA